MPLSPKISVEIIDAILPQTQCGDCGYPGCIPYAKAIVEEKAAIHLCSPGGTKTLHDIAYHLGRFPTEKEISAIHQKEKKPAVAKIREEECIGCTKCIVACPVDAIVGTAKKMHTVIQQECTGCGLCISPCPMDCIDLIALSKPSYDPLVARQRHQVHLMRLQRKQEEGINKKNSLQEKLAKQEYIRAAISRVKNKRQQLNDG